MSVTVVRVGLIGFGVGGAVFHAPLIASTPGLTLAAIVTSDAARARRAADTYPGAQVVASAQALFDLVPRLDLAVIATPNQSHVPLARQALDAGLHAVIDKPMAPTAAGAEALVEHARRSRRMLSVFHNRRWDGDFLTIVDLLQQGELGDVHRLESRFERWRTDAKPGWRQHAAPEEAGGLLYDLGSHLIDQARVLFGEVTHVYAELDRRVGGSEVDDDTFVALTHRSGVRSHLWMTALAAQQGPRFRVLGNRGAYTKFGLDPQEAALRARRRPGGAEWGEEDPESWGRLGAGAGAVPVRTRPGAYQAFYVGVRRAITDGDAPPVDPDDAVEVVRIIETARRAAAESRVIRHGAAI